MVADRAPRASYTSRWCAEVRRAVRISLAVETLLVIFTVFAVICEDGIDGPRIFRALGLGIAGAVVVASLTAVLALVLSVTTGMLVALLTQCWRVLVCIKTLGIPAFTWVTQAASDQPVIPHRVQAFKVRVHDVIPINGARRLALSLVTAAHAPPALSSWPIDRLAEGVQLRPGVCG
jgi:hypothetical protein